MLKAVIFDFNGVLVDDEPIHLEMFRKVLEEEGLSLSEKDYYERYLGMDDRSCFEAAFADQGRGLDDSALEELVRRKARYYRAAAKDKIALFPGVEKLVRELSGSYPLAIASGALREEIETILQRIGLREYFQVVVSAEDTSIGKPSPETFAKALSQLNEKRSQPILACECLVIEDSKEGILGARQAGMKCLAVANSYPADELTQADAVVRSLEKVSIPYLESLFG